MSAVVNIQQRCHCGSFNTVSTVLSLSTKGILLYSDYQASTFDVSKLPSYRFEAMDHFAKCFLILRLEGNQVDGRLNSTEGDSRGWRAVRVDLVAPPMDRYAFALLGWTGSRVCTVERKTHVTHLY